MRDMADPGPGTPASAAIPRLLDRHGPRLYALATRLCGNAEDARDMVQDVFLQAFRKWHTFKGESSPGTWLYAIAARACKARARRKGGIDRRMPAISQLMPWSETTNLNLASASHAARTDGRHGGSGRAAREEDGTSPSPVVAAIRRESARAVQRAILTLPEAFRVPLVLKEMLELSIEDVAGALGIKPETAKTRVHRARLMLRKAILASRGLPADAHRPAATPLYEKQVCLDLLRAKLDAMDRGKAAGEFPVPQGVVCERCRAVFAELDLAQNACAALAAGEMPARVREAIVRAVKRADAN
ncbi:MAG: sigma-70 family RNA polymerase sigma factor [Phycisphaerae bacterium]|nr:sigma-70 family RNA polymerase sigma factor [Phycisphaerae bacterium]